MDDRLATPAYQVNSFIIGQHRIEPGELCLEDGLIAFTSEGDRLVFRAPLPEVRASFPKVIFPAIPIPFFGVAIKLTIRGSTYLLSFVRVRYEREGSWSNSRSSWFFSWEDFEPARAAVRQWRAALGQPTTVTLRKRCLECGAETAAAAQVCVQCGAPVAQQRPT